MTRILATAALAALTFAAADAAAEPLELAAGVGTTAFNQVDEHWGYAPELVGYGYLGLGSHDLYLRPAVRAGFRGITQPEMPRDLRLREYDLAAAAELGIVRDGRVIPSLSAGAAAITRWTRLTTGDAVDATASMSDRTELMPAIYGQVGLGVPLGRAGIVAEPFVRYEHVFGDDRIGLSWGIELTVGLGDD